RKAKPAPRRSGGVLTSSVGIFAVVVVDAKDQREQRLHDSQLPARGARLLSDRGHHAAVVRCRWAAPAPTPAAAGEVLRTAGTSARPVPLSCKELPGDSASIGHRCHWANARPARLGPGRVRRARSQPCTARSQPGCLALLGRTVEYVEQDGHDFIFNTIHPSPFSDIAHDALKLGPALLVALLGN